MVIPRFEANSFKKIAVIGAGVMGAGIAALAAESGVEVLLLDIADTSGPDRSASAKRAVTRLSAGLPAAQTIEAGNIEDDFGKVQGCDWIIETIVEQLPAKQALYSRIEAVRRPGTMVSSNTSSIPLATLAEGMPPAFRRNFLITHFFNPPRQMRLMELVAGPDTDVEKAAELVQFCATRLRRRVVRAKDTPGFIANRIGVFWLQQALEAALSTGLTVEEADAAMGPPLGFSALGVFGLLDVLGIDLVPEVNARLSRALPGNDPFQEVARERPLITRMIADGRIGRKAGAGFYRRGPDGREALDLSTSDYRPCLPVGLPSDLAHDARALLAGEGPLSAYAWQVASAVLSYAASLAPAISDDISSVDEAMRLGFGWQAGPFQMLDQLGPSAIADRLRSEGRSVPPLLDRVGPGRFYAEVGERSACLGFDGGYGPIGSELTRRQAS